MGAFGPLNNSFMAWQQANAGNPSGVFGARYGNNAQNDYAMQTGWMNDPSQAAQVQAYSDQTFGASGQSRPTLGRLNGGGVVRRNTGPDSMRGVFGMQQAMPGMQQPRQMMRRGGFSW